MTRQLTVLRDVFWRSVTGQVQSDDVSVELGGASLRHHQLGAGSYRTKVSAIPPEPRKAGGQLRHVVAVEAVPERGCARRAWTLAPALRRDGIGNPVHGGRDRVMSTPRSHAHGTNWFLRSAAFCSDGPVKETMTSPSP